ncbi:MAG: aspartate--tRNA(Asn) ligase [Candidatus Pacearchaeota archaeon]|nr:MAG: aspartate--tRNA(Asn) ligase [Candidatus Pacearchaeota archaeon]
MKNKRVYVNEIKKGPVFLQGWVHELRDLAKVKFILLRDVSGIIQCVVKDKKLFKDFSKLTLESVVAVKGKVNAAKIKSPEVTRKEIEIEITNIDIINKAEQLPILVVEKDKTIKTDLSKRLDYRSLDIRKQKVKAIFYIQSEIVHTFREFFKKNKFVEIQTPCIIASASEGGTALFPVQYFEKKAFLAQSPQLYKQLAAISFEKVTCVVPVWRAEKHNTVRHLNESRQMDMEMAFADDFDVMKYLEACIQFMISEVNKNCKKELELLSLKLKIPKAKYLSYDETIKLLQKNKSKTKQGEDLAPEDEKILYKLYPDTIIFVHSWPNKLKPFYIWPKDKKVSAGFDALYGGIEISSGGQRVHVPEILIKRLKEQRLNPANFKHYIDSFRFGAPYHSGWSIGLERFTMALLGLDNIREGCLFPRDRERLTP